MAQGRPDFTYLADTDIIAQTIASIAVDIAAQSVGNLAVDIVAQALAALKVDITAQTLAQLNVDIIAQTLSAMAVNITAQDLAELIINIAAQNVGIYLQPEWAAKEGTDKTLLISAGSKTWGQYVEGSYTVPAGKTLYITYFEAEIYATTAAESNNPQHYNLGLVNITDNAVLIHEGGDGGHGWSLSKPVAVAAGKQIDFRITNRSNNTCNIAAVWGGYEI